MALILIAAVDRNLAIGKNNRLIYRVPEDMRRFRTLTAGNTVLYGRKTLESFPDAKPLKNRRNIVLSRNYVNSSGFENLVVARSVEEVVSLIPEGETAFVCGGESVYRALLPFCDRAMLTEIDAETEGCDAFFPDLRGMPEWERACIGEEQVSESGLHFRFVDYARKSPAP